MATATSPKVPVTATQLVANSPLFKLSPELRNQIYEYAVYNHTEKGYNKETNELRVSATNGVAEPATLVACKAVRSEAIGIFHGLLSSLSGVTLEIESFHPAALVLWERKKTTLSRQYGFDLDSILTNVCHSGSIDRYNLDNWLECYHDGTAKIGFKLSDPSLDLDYSTEHLIYLMFGIVDMGRDGQWDDVANLVFWAHEPLYALDHDRIMEKF